MIVKTPNINNLEEGIRRLGEELIEKSEEISKMDLTRVRSIEIKATIEPSKVYNYDINFNRTISFKEEE